ncbi:hypothetical protein C8J57DRAFT_1274889, partial [Mycena rebaudengoi]
MVLRLSVHSCIVVITTFHASQTVSQPPERKREAEFDGNFDPGRIVGGATLPMMGGVGGGDAGLTPMSEAGGMGMRRRSANPAGVPAANEGC